MHVVVTGPPASGKSTLAPALARALGLPLLAKDTLKGGLLDVLGADDVEASRRLGRAAVAALLAVARDNDGAVLDSVWVDRDRAARDLAALGDVVEVFCRADVATMRARYATRARGRAPGHFDEDRPEEELWPAAALAPLAAGWRVVEVDTAAPVDVEAVAREVVR